MSRALKTLKCIVLKFVPSWLTCHFASGQCSPSSRTDVRCGGCALAGRELAAPPTSGVSGRTLTKN
ncbi:hypothetical protein FVB43_12075 [Erwinia rhapontici]|nr:hypothetical protein [Erwinia rhapontici]